MFEGGVLILGFIGIGICVALLAHILFPILLPPAYKSSLGYMDILIITVIAGMPGGLVETYFRTCQDEKSQYFIRTVAAIVGVITPTIFIFIWGAYGAAFGRLLANIALSIVGLILFARDTRQVNLLE